MYTKRTVGTLFVLILSIALLVGLLGGTAWAQWTDLTTDIPDDYDITEAAAMLIRSDECVILVLTSIEVSVIPEDAANPVTDEDHAFAVDLSSGEDPDDYLFVWESTDYDEDQALEGMDEDCQFLGETEATKDWYISVTEACTAEWQMEGESTWKIQAAADLPWDATVDFRVQFTDQQL